MTALRELAMTDMHPDDDDDYEDFADGFCECGVFHTIEEIDSGHCDFCGKSISPEEYS